MQERPGAVTFAGIGKPGYHHLKHFPRALVVADPHVSEAQVEIDLGHHLIRQFRRILTLHLKQVLKITYRRLQAPQEVR